MSSSHKIFIYYDKDSAQSIDDLNELLSTAEIFPTKSDVRICTFNQINFDGLTNPTFVIPGGNSTLMGGEIAEQMKTIKALFGERFNFLGVCAGGFLGTETADIYQLSYRQIVYMLYDEPKYNYSYKEHLHLGDQNYDFNLRLVKDYKSVGPFYPNLSFIDTQPQQYMPYCVNVSIGNTDKKLAQLYVAGPAFVPHDAKQDSTTQVLARYYAYDSLMFGKNGTLERYPRDSAAIIAKRATETSGGCMLTATHIEACVKDSKMLKAFETKSEYSPGLFKRDLETLRNQAEETQAEVVKMMKATFNP
jgi:glutamine amidotransferase-like uncharacterized protein